MDHGDNRLEKRVTVFGGTGFLGHHIVNRLLQDGFVVRVAARHPERISAKPEFRDRMELIEADIRDHASVMAAVSGAQAVVNAVGLYVERNDATFRAVHVDGARRVAEASRQSGATRLIHISGIGSDASARSPYVKSRGEGEEAVRSAFEHATIFRPSVMFGPDDALIDTLASLAKKLPVIPLFGNGGTRLQPVFVGDVAQAIARLFMQSSAVEKIYELGGPEIWTYRKLLKRVMQVTGHKRPIIPVPFFAWDMIAMALSVLPDPPLTEGQVALLKRDNVVSPNMPGFQELNLSPLSLEARLKQLSNIAPRSSAQFVAW